MVCSICSGYGHNRTGCEKPMYDTAFRILEEDPTVVLSTYPEVQVRGGERLKELVIQLQLVRTDRLHSIVLYRHQSHETRRRGFRRYILDRQTNQVVDIPSNQDEYKVNLEFAADIWKYETKRAKRTRDTYTLGDTLVPDPIEDGKRRRWCRPDLSTEREIFVEQRRQWASIELDNDMRRAWGGRPITDERVRALILQSKREEILSRGLPAPVPAPVPVPEQGPEQEQDPVPPHEYVPEPVYIPAPPRLQELHTGAGRRQEERGRGRGAPWCHRGQAQSLPQKRDNVIVTTDCPVCMEDLGETDKAILRCGHQLCMACCVKIKRECPICRGRWI